MSNPSSKLVAVDALKAFSCIGADCPDTCCSGWIISVDDETRLKYSVLPDLRAACVKKEDEDEWKMRANEKTGLCTKHESGLCGVITKYGEDYLSDTCYLYPRIFTRLGDTVYGSTLLSCPEAARIALFGGLSFKFEDYENPRASTDYVNYLPEELSAEDARAMSAHLMALTQDASLSPEQLIARIAHAAFALEKDKRAEWKEKLTHYFALKDSELPALETVATDPMNIVVAALILAIDMDIEYRPRLYRTLRDCERAFGMDLHWADGTVMKNPTAGNWTAIQESWKKYGKSCDQALRNWIAVQLLNHMFPFSGRTKSLGGQGVVIAVRFATLKIALMCACHLAQEPLSEAEFVRVTQSLSRMFDHITRLSGSIDFYNTYGWYTPGRLSALAGFEPSAA